jgi:hypothetical protein
MSDAAFNLRISLEKIDCPSCAAVYALNEDFINRRRKDGIGWVCPYCKAGTTFGGDSENERLKKQLAEEQARKTRALDEANRLRADVLTTSREVERLKQRAANGVCPCCTRTFSNVAQHIKEKHPQYRPGSGPKDTPKTKAKSEYAKRRLEEINGGKP